MRSRNSSVNFYPLSSHYDLGKTQVYNSIYYQQQECGAGLRPLYVINPKPDAFLESEWQHKEARFIKVTATEFAEMLKATCS